MGGQIGTKFGTHVRIYLGVDIYKLNKMVPRDPRGAFGVYRGSKIWEIYQMAGPNGTKFRTRTDSSGNGHRQKMLPHETPGGGALRGSKIQKSGKSNKCLDRLAPNMVRLRIHLGMDIG